MTEKRKVSPKSTINVRNRQRNATYGDLDREGKEWTNEEIDALLEGFLVQDLRYVNNGDRPSYRSICRRQEASISSMLWKLFTRYDRASVRNYTPKKRTDRTGSKFTIRDRAILEGATGKIGRENNAFASSYLSAILGRQESEVVRWMRVLADRSRKRMIFAPPVVGAREEAEMVNRVVKGSWKQAMRDVGFASRK